MTTATHDNLEEVLTAAAATIDVPTTHIEAESAIANDTGGTETSILQNYQEENILMPETQKIENENALHRVSVEETGEHSSVGLAEEIMHVLADTNATLDPEEALAKMHNCQGEIIKEPDALLQELDSLEQLAVERVREIEGEIMVSAKRSLEATLEDDDETTTKRLKLVDDLTTEETACVTVSENISSAEENVLINHPNHAGTLPDQIVNSDESLSKICDTANTIPEAETIQKNTLQMLSIPDTSVPNSGDTISETGVARGCVMNMGNDNTNENAFFENQVTLEPSHEISKETSSADVQSNAQVSNSQTPVNHRVMFGTFKSRVRKNEQNTVNATGKTHLTKLESPTISEKSDLVSLENSTANAVQKSALPSDLAEVKSSPTMITRTLTRIEFLNALKSGACHIMSEPGTAGNRVAVLATSDFHKEMFGLPAEKIDGEAEGNDGSLQQDSNLTFNLQLDAESIDTTQEKTQTPARQHEPEKEGSNSSLLHHSRAQRESVQETMPITHQQLMLNPLHKKTTAPTKEIIKNAIKAPLTFKSKTMRMEMVSELVTIGKDAVTQKLALDKSRGSKIPEKINKEVIRDNSDADLHFSLNSSASTSSSHKSITTTQKLPYGSIGVGKMASKNNVEMISAITTTQKLPYGSIGVGKMASKNDVEMISAYHEAELNFKANSSMSSKSGTVTNRTLPSTPLAREESAKSTRPSSTQDNSTDSPSISRKPEIHHPPPLHFKFTYENLRTNAKLISLPSSLWSYQVETDGKFVVFLRANTDSFQTAVDKAIIFEKTLRPQVFFSGKPVLFPVPCARNVDDINSIINTVEKVAFCSGTGITKMPHSPACMGYLDVSNPENRCTSCLDERRHALIANQLKAKWRLSRIDGSRREALGL